MRSTASRGRGAAIVARSGTAAHLHRASVRFKAFGTSELGDGRRQLRQRRRREFLHGDDLDEISRRKASSQSGGARSGKHVIWARAVVTGRFGTERTEENAAGVPNAGQ